MNILKTRKQEHSRKPDELYNIIEKCSRGPFLEMFARGSRSGWDVFGNESEAYLINWKTYSHNSKQATASRIKNLEIAVGSTKMIY